MNPLISQKLPMLVALCKKYHVKRLYLFGSATTEHFSDKSDIDFLYSFDEDLLLIDYADNFLDFAVELEYLFGRDVDLIAENTLSNPYFIESVERTKQLLYAA